MFESDIKCVILIGYLIFNVKSFYNAIDNATIPIYCKTAELTVCKYSNNNVFL